MVLGFSVHVMFSWCGARDPDAVIVEVPFHFEIHFRVCFHERHDT